MLRSAVLVSVILVVMAIPPAEAQGVGLLPRSTGPHVGDGEASPEAPAAERDIAGATGAPATDAAGRGTRWKRPDFDVPQLTSTWLVTVGGSFNTFDTNAAWSPTGLSGALLILENSLGLDEETGTAFLRVRRRINPRHSIALAVTDLDRTATRVIDSDIEWGEYVFRAQGKVASQLTTRIINLTWRYDFSDSERLNAGFSAGLATFDLGLRLQGEARFENEAGEEWVEGAVEGADVLAPLPVLGFYIEYALAPRWILRFNTEAIDVDLGSSGGRVLQTNFALEHAFSDLFGVGIGLGGIDLRYHSAEGDEEFGMNYRIKSVGAYASFAF